MRILTYNLWHGLSPSTPLMLEALEPTARLKLREQLQLRLIHDLKPDIGFFQEVNPVQRRAKEFHKDFGFTTNFQPDLSGIKLFGYGIPVNMNAGLLTAVAERRTIKKIAAISLSRPGFNLVRSFASWQLREERFALFSEVLMPEFGRVLLINTHLHHGFELTAEFLARLEQTAKELELSESLMSELKERMAKGDERRLQEIKTLLSHLEQFEHRYELVILGGDLNCSPDTAVHQLLADKGYTDMWESARPNDPGLTFDRERNPANHILQAHFPVPLVVEDLSFSKKVKETLLTLSWNHYMRPRRIDYLWYRVRSLKLNIKSADLLGLPDQSGLAPSDHFGVCADIEVM
jgi:endonuclease/exonuclease/phosphatase family metal-dependent hydrolase